MADHTNGVRIRLNRRGFQQLRRATGVVADLERRAAAIAAAANRSLSDGDDYRTSSQQGAARPYGRWRTTVITATAAAKRDNATSNTLLRSLDAGRS